MIVNKLQVKEFLDLGFTSVHSGVMRKRIRTHAFIDASNIIYGTRDEGWKVDFEKLFKYLSERYKCRKIFYFGGEEKKNVKVEQKFKSC